MTPKQVKTPKVCEPVTEPTTFFSHFSVENPVENAVSLTPARVGECLWKGDGFAKKVVGLSDTGNPWYNYNLTLML